MASTRERYTKDGRRFYEIRVSRGRGVSALSKNWYVPDGWAESTVQRELIKVACEFERLVKAGEVISRDEQKEIAKQAALEAAKLKTVRQYADSVFMSTKALTMSQNGRASYQMFLDKHILPYIGDMLLVEVTPAILSKRLLDFQKRGYSHATCVKMYNVMNGLFDMAFMDDSIKMNPMLKVKRPVAGKNERVTEEEEKALTVEQVRDLFAVMESEPLKWKAFTALAIDTGMRRGELCGLQWSDIDRENAIITVKRNLQYSSGKGVFETTPKNGKTRKVDIGQDTLSLLSSLKEEQKKTGRLSRYVFTQDGTTDAMFPTSPTRYFARLGKRCGIPGLHPHMFRHTSASISILNGADVVSVSKRLGHSDTAITLRLYSHADQESVKRAGQIARDAIKAKIG